MGHNPYQAPSETSANPSSFRMTARFASMLKLGAYGSFSIAVLIPTIMAIEVYLAIDEGKRDQVMSTRSILTGITFLVAAVLAAIAGLILVRFSARMASRAAIAEANYLANVFEFDNEVLSIRGMQVLGAAYLSRYFERLGLSAGLHQKFCQQLASIGKEENLVNWRRACHDPTFVAVAGSTNAPQSQQTINQSVMEPEAVAFVARQIAELQIGKKGLLPISAERLAVVVQAAKAAGVEHIDSRKFECFSFENHDWGKVCKPADFQQLCELFFTTHSQ